jgi:2-polyprenyl-6-methoxyphenol hydroxylase-like FAD-dependent oxidoreductase
MRLTDIAIAGGGLAGSAAAAMLSRAGHDVVLIDPHEIYPPDFRCEKLDGAQMLTLEKTGLAPALLRTATRNNEIWVARSGYLVDKRRNDQCGIMYNDMVNTMRGAVAPGAGIINAKVMDVATSAERQTLKLSNGEEVSARLVVMANGLNTGLRQAIGLEREVISANHSISVGFDIKPVGRAAFGFPALTYFSERVGARMAYITLFPIGPVMRANAFFYRDLHDPWLRELRDHPLQTLLAVMPGLTAITGAFEVTGFVKIRPVDLYATTGYRRAGMALIGDAFATSCPAAGTGAGKVLVDVERLCNVHIPHWLATPGMGDDKTAAFYDDPVKTASDAFSLDKAFHLRSLSIDDGLAWRVRRWGKFLSQLGVGKLRQITEPAPSRRPTPPAPAVGSGAAP